MDTKEKIKYINEKQTELQFSGTYFAQNERTTLSGCSGMANRSEGIANEKNTRFTIASGSKVFTAVAICMLVDEGKLTFETKVTDCLDIELPFFDDRITVHHLLTHTSGVYDYFNEDLMDDYEALWTSRPMYQMRQPRDFLPMFQYEKMQAEVDSGFQYNNTGYILLGLIIEQIAKCHFTEFIEKNIFQKASMIDSGYFFLDHLPSRTAYGYIEDEQGNWKTNIFSIPVIGGPDGGAYITAEDRGKFWTALINHQLLSKEMTDYFLKPHEAVVPEDDIYYGYCGYMELDEQQKVVKLIQMGYDPGVNFREVYYPDTKTIITVCSNTEDNAYELLREIETIL